MEKSNLEVGSRVKIAGIWSPWRPRYGIIRWIGHLPRTRARNAGIELENTASHNCSDGTYLGKRYFSCPLGKAFFHPVDQLRPDSRVGSEPVIPLADNAQSTRENQNQQLASGSRRNITPAQQSFGREMQTAEQRTINAGVQQQQDQQLIAELLRHLTTARQGLRREKEQRQAAEQRAENAERQHREDQQRITELSGNLTIAQQVLRPLRERTEQQLQARQRRIAELTTTLATAQRTIEEYRQSESHDWVISRDEVHMSDRSLGVGGWGAVVEGTFRGTKVAVKQIHELILSPHNRRLFEREMNIASRCRHPCLLQFIGATNDAGSPLFVTELMETSLRSVLRQRFLTLSEVLVISLDVARALNYLHLNKPTPIIHRDISSGNVLLWRQPNTLRGKVSDYGTANFVHQEMTTAPGAPPYSAPEAMTSAQSPRLDVYSFGVLLCEMCTRESPDRSQREQQIALVTNHALRNLVRRCVQQNPKVRPTMEEILNELETQNVRLCS